MIGETPNLAARLQAAAAPGQVVVGEATRRLLGDMFELEDLGGRKVKGLQGPVRAFAVSAERAIESRFEARHGGGLAAIVGRDQEQGLLLDRWQRACHGEGQVVLLTGEAGIGKSRIVRALLDRVGASGTSAFVASARPTIPAARSIR
ncbi:MAG: AAA family ATPase [Geminicoccaceae bacterium]